jgi:hypothetical protein
MCVLYTIYLNVYHISSLSLSFFLIAIILFKYLYSCACVCVFICIIIFCKVPQGLTFIAKKFQCGYQKWGEGGHRRKNGGWEIHFVVLSVPTVRFGLWIDHIRWPRLGTRWTQSIHSLFSFFFAFF